jgi:hypothetical protein
VLFFFSLIYNVFLSTLFSTAVYLPPVESNVSEDAGMEPMIVATLALSVRRSGSHHRVLFLAAVS